LWLSVRIRYSERGTAQASLKLMAYPDIHKTQMQKNNTLVNGFHVNENHCPTGEV